MGLAGRGLVGWQLKDSNVQLQRKELALDILSAVGNLPVGECGLWCVVRGEQRLGQTAPELPAGVSGLAWHFISSREAVPEVPAQLLHWRAVAYAVRNEHCRWPGFVWGCWSRRWGRSVRSAP